MLLLVLGLAFVQTGCREKPTPPEDSSEAQIASALNDLTNEQVEEIIDVSEEFALYYFTLNFEGLRKVSHEDLLERVFEDSTANPEDRPEEFIVSKCEVIKNEGAQVQTGVFVLNGEDQEEEQVLASYLLTLQEAQGEYRVIDFVVYDREQAISEWELEVQ